MKSTKLFVAAVMLAVCTSASAQFMNTSSSITSVGSNSSADAYNVLYFEYDPMTLKFDVDNSEDMDFTSFGIGFTHGTSISANHPLFLETGLALNLTNWSDSDDDVDYSVKLFSAKVPVNFVYKYNIPNSEFSLAPYAGLSLRYNFSGTLKGEYYNGEKKVDLFDKKDMDSNSATWKRFQIGWQIGCKLVYNKAIFGLSYGSDFSEIMKKGKFSTTSLSLGFLF